MIYAEHFGLQEAPFNATPDPRFFYSNRDYEEAYATLVYGLRARQGFIVLTGEVGTGKTTLLRRLMDELSGTTRFVFLYHTTLTPDELVDAICAELDLPVLNSGSFRQLRILNDFLLGQAERGESVVLLVDEAQNLSPGVLEHLRLISNLETSREKLLQIVLVGQPELQARLADPRLRQVRQRIAMRYHLSPLPPAEVDAFIRHRLRVAGRDAGLFSAAAVRRIATYTDGIPRLINIMGNAALLLAYASDAQMVSGRMVDETAQDLLLRRPASAAARRPVPLGRARARPPSRALPRVAGGVTVLLLASVAVGWVLEPGLSGRQTDVPHLAGIGHRGAGPTSARAVEAVPTSRATPAHPALTPAVPEPAEPGPPERERPFAHRIVVPPDTSVTEIVSERYGSQRLLALDLVDDLNPDIRNLDVVFAGQTLWLPDLSPEARVRREAGGAYRLIVTALPRPDAVRLARAIRRTGHVPVITSRVVTPDMTVYRVEIAHLADRDAVTSAWRDARRHGWVTEDVR